MGYAACLPLDSPNVALSGAGYPSDSGPFYFRKTSTKVYKEFSRGNALVTAVP
jgi:NAD-dependent SIR2 family protein deacetylase